MGHQALPPDLHASYCPRPKKGPFMHYPHRVSKIKRKRSIGFRARMKTKAGRKMMNRKRRVGRSLNVADK